jgi:hypothetical protein
MIEGFFRIAFTGTAGSGFGVLVLRNGSVAGADVGGVIYDGTYTENPSTGEISIKLDMIAPAGASLVQTGIPLTTPKSVPITAIIDKANMNSDKPTLLQTPLGPVNVVFKKIRDIQ